MDEGDDQLRVPTLADPVPVRRGDRLGHVRRDQTPRREGEIGDDGRVHGVSVCPAPYTKPYPPVFVASNASQQTIEYAGDKDFIPTYFSSIKTALEVRCGLRRTRGEGRSQLHLRPEPGARALDADRAHDRGGPPGHRGLRRRDLQEPLSTAHSVDAFSCRRPPFDSVLDSGLFSAGTVDEVKDELRLPVDRVPRRVRRSHLPLLATAEGVGGREPRSVHEQDQARARRVDRLQRRRLSPHGPRAPGSARRGRGFRIRRRSLPRRSAGWQLVTVCTTWSRSTDAPRRTPTGTGPRRPTISVFGG